MVVTSILTGLGLMVQEQVYNIESMAKTLSDLIKPRPVSVEVTTNNLDEMVHQARKFASWASNIVIKVPQLTQEGIPCYEVINQLETEGIKVNATVTFSLGQVIVAAKAGASYISIFAGRIADEGGNAPEVIRNSVNWLEHWGFKSKIITGSIRSVGDVLNAAIAGSHIITIPPQILDKMVDHKYTRETVREFTEKAQALEKMKNRNDVIEIGKLRPGRTEGV